MLVPIYFDNVKVPGYQNLLENMIVFLDMNDNNQLKCVTKEELETFEKNRTYFPNTYKPKSESKKASSPMSKEFISYNPYHPSHKGKLLLDHLSANISNGQNITLYKDGLYHTLSLHTLTNCKKESLLAKVDQGIISFEKFLQKIKDHQRDKLISDLDHKGWTAQYVFNYNDKTRRTTKKEPVYKNLFLSTLHSPESNSLNSSLESTSGLSDLGRTPPHSTTSSYSLDSLSFDMTTNSPLRKVTSTGLQQEFPNKKKEMDPKRKTINI